ncbi:helicase HerA domain-containing protein [Paeniglutamicibacter kerguelensis]|uniref:helicase HerA domain-containing protein n=1 Tax=Paeniglutamicibacter kerguelensis TaxID=254788 RepID=UPI003611DC8E
MVFLKIGSPLGDPEGAVELRAERFNRHTFWCGQSGSGKTYALGVVLEQLLLHTELPMLIFDPNADFTHLDQTRPEAGSEATRGIADAGIRVLDSTRPDGPQVRIRFLSLSVASKAAVLQLDPIRDAEEFNVLLHLDFAATNVNEDTYTDSLRASGDPGRAKLATRIENLQVLEWELWSRGGGSVTDIIDSRPRPRFWTLGASATRTNPRSRPWDCSNICGQPATSAGHC